MRKKVLFIGHEYHRKTKSSDFMQNIIARDFDLEFFTLDPYKGSIDDQLSPLKNKKYDIVVLWQMMPSLNKLKEYIKFKYCSFFPMYDGAPSRDNPIWYEYRDVNIINFSKTLHEELKELGFSSFYFQFFPKPLKITNEGNEKSVFFWQRTNDITIDTVSKLIDMNKINHIHMHHAIDPNHTFIEPSEKIKKKMTTSTWFDTREEMQKQMQKSAIYIAPRAYEGIGMSFLEAMAMGRVVIAPNNPTMNEYITDSVNGLLYELHEPKPVDISDIRGMQQRTIDYIEKGFAKWETEKWNILKVIDSSASFNPKKLKQKYAGNTEEKETCFYLFNVLPLISIVKKDKKQIYKIFRLLPIYVIKRHNI